MSTEREVKKANREINSLTAKFDELGKIDFLQKKVSEHLAQMKRLERENKKNKTSRDLLQKQKDELSLTSSKTTSLKDKLEKLCRELQRENNRLKVRSSI
jgi:chromosome segregation ATPase